MHEYYPKSPIICRGPLATAVLKVDTLKSSPILFWGVVDYALADRLHIGFLLHPSRGECTRVGREGGWIVARIQERLYCMRRRKEDLEGRNSGKKKKSGCVQFSCR